MRLVAPVLILALATTATALAQELPELPEAEPLPPTIEASLLGTLASDEILDRVRRWEGELYGDATPDQLVQATIAFKGGGNAYYLRHWIFVGAGDGYSIMIPITLDNGLRSVRLDGGDLVLTTYKYLDGDPNCCPSGSATVRMPLR
jgi:hypothetical protein